MQKNQYRINSIDILRGLVMIIMALDHTRDYFHSSAITADPMNPETTTIPLYFTRWITHYCAPIFVLLSGISAFLSSKNKSRKEASAFLIKRGIWLVIVEIVIVTLGIFFNPFYNFIMLQVIWAIGCSMILLGLLTRISGKLILPIGLLLVVGHNALDYANLPATGFAANIWKVFFTARGTIIPLGPAHFIGAFYAILPWTGIMFTGYAMGRWFVKEMDASRRKKLLLITGSAMIVLFIVSRLLQGYGDPGRWVNGEHSLLSFLDTSKYPPSLQYTCMTLGPGMILLALLENIKARWTDVVSIYGRVPFFYYILHIYLLHFLLVIVFFASGYGMSQIASDPPFLFRPRNFGYGLPVVYLIWISVVGVLYLPCKWFNKYKMEHGQWWLKYI
ncbi:DUF1624 domain-containing protein [Ferruginibacter sp. HRS2-29]|uniref:DUF1624 domain-containing protein n=1 Tax=Ferruginibacter sp. HRS2-29 TaxID=2487334 RepID=UPI0020CDE880|nr:heparan-alpha-glucosaminide N-acetyltransferase domain-containing protein [Ferruginibacter sp. HRS2-29]MCP9753341.1 DUF1624 domain-containing protein [Ferruginibacter sp. HRS2-29]